MNPADARSVDILHTLGLTEDMVRNHVFRPHHVTTAAPMLEAIEDNIQSNLLSFVIAAGSALAAVGLYRRARATRRPA